MHKPALTIMATSEILPIQHGLHQLKVNILKGHEPVPFIARKYDKGVHIQTCVHQHPEAEVCFMPWDAGVMLIDNLAYRFRPGDMFLTPGNTYHHPVFDSPDNRGLIVVYFSTQFVDQIPSAWIDLKRLLTSPGGGIKLEGSLQAAALMLEMEVLLHPAGKGDNIICQGVFLHLMSYFAEELSLRSQHLHQKNHALIKKFCKILDYIHANISSDIDLSDLHRQAGLSRSRFCEQFRACFGMTAIQYIQQARLEKSKSLLRSSALSISEIAYICGYNWPSFFNRTFKKRTGVSPSEFRRSLDSR